MRLAGRGLPAETGFALPEPDRNAIENVMHPPLALVADDHEDTRAAVATILLPGSRRAGWDRGG